MSTGRAKPGMIKRKVPPASGNEKKTRGRGRGKDQQQSANQLQKEAGGRGVNPVPRSAELPQVGTASLVPVNEQLSIPVQPILDDGALKSLALGSVLMAVVKGFGAKDPAQPWFAYNYLLVAFKQAASGGTPALTMAPRWFWELIYMLHPKSYRMKTGSIAYAWTLQDETVSPLLDIGFGKNVYWGTADLTPSTQVNGFNVLVDPPSYDEKSGLNSFQATYNFFPDEGMFQRIPDPQDKAFLFRDVSAYQASYPEWGGSQVASNGGLATSQLSEVVLQNPVLAKFTGYQEGPVWRGFQHMFKNAGTPCFLGPRISTMRDPREISCKHSPIFKFYNFDHYFCQLSYTLAKAMELSNSQNATTPVAQCPLTPWEAQLLLRQSMINKFSNVYAQDLLQTGSNTLGMVPFVTANNGVSIVNQDFTEPLYPRMFAESIRAISLRIIKLRGRNKSHVTFVPILARHPTVPQMGQFQYQVGSSFLNLYEENRTSVDVDLIDMSVPNTTPTQYITPNVTQITELVTSWNAWIRSLSPYLSALTSLGSEAGIAVLDTVYCTQHLTVYPPVPQIVTSPAVQVPTMQRKSSKEIFRGEKLERKKLGEPRPAPQTGGEFYSDVGLESITSLNPILKPLLKYFAVMVKPSYTATIANIQESNVTFQQVLQIEPFTLPQSLYSQFNNISTKATLSSQFLAAATYDVRQLLSAPSEMEIDFDELQKKGDGGFFTSLAGNLGQALGWSGAGQFFDEVGKVIDI